MKKIISAFLVLALAFALGCTAFAANDSYFNADVTVTANLDGSVTVTVTDSPVLSEKKPSLSVSFGGNSTSSVLHAGTVTAVNVPGGKATFQVSEGGTYTVAAGEYTAEMTTKPGCTTDGKYTYTNTSASASNKTYTEVIPATGHDFDGNRQYCANGCGTRNPNYVPPYVPPVEPEQPENPFEDVSEGAYYYDAVLWAVREGVTEGTSATTFSPDDTCTRGEMAAFLWKAAGSPEAANRENPFADVSETAYYYKAVLWAVENGITEGTSADMFSPDDICTRGQMSVFLYRYAGSPTVSGDSPFVDVAANTYYYNAILWAVQKGITVGTSKTTFSPDDSCTRAQIVTFLYRYNSK